MRSWKMVRGRLDGSMMKSTVGSCGFSKSLADSKKDVRGGAEGLSESLVAPPLAPVPPPVVTFNWEEAADGVADGSSKLMVWLRR